jgi:two-component system, chemotaxis family, chemotaxis protein CheY
MDLNIKILIIDNFATMRKILKNILKQIGFKNISEADDGKSALKILKIVKPFTPETVREKLNKVFGS